MPARLEAFVSQTAQPTSRKRRTEAMNPTEKRIFDIIKADVCGMCPHVTVNVSFSLSCNLHRDRCYAGYERQAREIYRLVMAPLEKKDE